MTFHCGDVAEHSSGTSTIVLLDVLHYLPQQLQRDLLAKLARADGAVIIRNGLRDDSWRYRLTLLEE